MRAKAQLALLAAEEEAERRVRRREERAHLGGATPQLERVARRPARADHVALQQPGDPRCPVADTPDGEAAPRWLC